MIEFPKCLYKNHDFTGDTLTVNSSEEQAVAAGDGWLTCEQIYGLEAMPEPAQPADEAPKRKAKK
jgi:hypothetical protein